MLKATYIRKEKRPNGSGFWGAYRTAEDEFGVWLFTPRGSLYRGECGGSVVYCNVGSPQGPGIPVIHLVPREAWWMATFWAPNEVDWSVTFDVSTPPRFDGVTWTYVDLELDVLVNRATSHIHVDDEDEFRAAVDLALISPDEAAFAKRAVDQIRELLSWPADPLGHAGDARLTDALTLGLDPIRQLP